MNLARTFMASLTLTATIVLWGAESGLRPRIVETQFSTEDVVIASRVLTPPEDPSTDAGTVLQAAIDEAAGAGGAVLFLQAGHYPVRSRLILHEGVILRGDWAPAEDGTGTRGTILDIFAGMNEPDGEPAITMERGSGLRNLSIWYPEQRVADPVPYAWTLRTSKTVAGDNTSIIDVTLVNPFQGIKIGPEGNELHTIRNVQITPLNTGISIDSTTDIGRLNEVTISPKFWIQSGLPGAPVTDTEQGALKDWMFEQVTGVDIGRSDWEYLYQVTVEDCARGFVFRKGARGTTNAVMYGCRTSADCGTGLLLEHLNGIGLSATACDFGGCEATVRAPETFTTAVQFHSCRLRAPSEYGVLLEGPGLMTFQTCTFEEAGQAALKADQGIVSALDCDFLGTAPLVVLGREMKRVRLLGNRFAGGPQIQDRTAFADVQISHAPLPMPRPDVSPHQESPFPRPERNDVFVATDFGLSSELADNGPVLQKALDAAARAGGGTVYLPAGNYPFTSEIIVPAGVELRGIYDVPHHTISAGSVLMPRCGKGQEEGTPFIRLSPGSGLRGITVWYPEQNPLDPVVYPWTVQSLGERCWLVDVTLGNPYQAVDFWTYPSTGHVIRYLAGGMFRRGLRVSKCDGDGWVEDVQFNPHYVLRLHKSLPHPEWDGSAGGRLIDYEREHLEGMVFGRCTREHMRGNFLYAAFDGIAFRDDDGGTNARIFLHGTDTASRAAVIASAGKEGIQFINAQLVPLGKWAEAAIVTTPSFTGKVSFANTQVWAGPATAILQGTGDVLIQQLQTLSGGMTIEGGHAVLQNINWEKDLDGHVQAKGSAAQADLLATMYRGGVFLAAASEGAVLRSLGASVSIPVDMSMFDPASTIPASFAWDGEKPDSPFIPDTIVHDGGGIRTVSAGSCTLVETDAAHSGRSAIRIHGHADGPHSFIYFTIFETPLTIFPDSVLSYWVRPVNGKGRHVAIDMQFTDGTVLRDSGIGHAHPGNPKGKVAEWTQYRFVLGTRLAGKTVRKLMCAYDSSGGEGDFEALFDDIQVESAIGSGGTLTAVFTPAPGTYPSGTTVCGDAPADCRIHYTLDGLNPSAASPVMREPIPLNRTGMHEIRTVIERKDGSLSPIVQSALYTIR